MKVQISCEGQERAINNALDLQTLLELAHKHGWPVESSCGGAGSCGVCKVRVEMGNGLSMPPRGEVELEIAEYRGFSDDERLACQWEIEEGQCLHIYPNKREE